MGFFDNIANGFTQGAWGLFNPSKPPSNNSGSGIPFGDLYEDESSGGGGGGGGAGVDHFFDVNPLDQAKHDHQVKMDDWQIKFNESQQALDKLKQERDYALSIGDQNLAKQKQSDYNHWQGVQSGLDQQRVNLENQGQQLSYHAQMAGIDQQRQQAGLQYQVGMQNAKNDAERNAIQSQWNATQAQIAQIQDQTQRYGIEIGALTQQQANQMNLALGQQQNQTGQFNAETQRQQTMQDYNIRMAGAKTDFERAEIEERRRQDIARIAEMEDRSRFTLGQQSNQTDAYNAETQRAQVENQYNVAMANATTESQRAQIEDKRRQDLANIATMEDRTRFTLGQQQNEIGAFNADTERQRADQNYRIGMANATNDAERTAIEDRRRQDMVSIANMEEANKFALGQQGNQTNQFGAETDRAARMGDLALKNNQFILDAAGKPRNLYSMFMMQRGVAPDWDTVLSGGTPAQGAALVPANVMGAYTPTTNAPNFNLSAQQAQAQPGGTGNPGSSANQWLNDGGYKAQSQLPVINGQHQGVAPQGAQDFTNPNLNKEFSLNPTVSLPNTNQQHQGNAPVAGQVDQNEFIGAETGYTPTTQAPNFNLDPHQFDINTDIPDTPAPTYNDVAAGAGSVDTSVPGWAQTGTAPKTDFIPYNNTPIGQPKQNPYDINPGGLIGGVPQAGLKPGMNISTVGGGDVKGSDFNYGTAYYDEQKTRPIGANDTVLGGSQVWVDVPAYANGTELTGDGWTKAPAFWSGDHPGGEPNPELIKLRVRDGRPEAKVIPTNSPLAASYGIPGYATGTGARRGREVGRKVSRNPYPLAGAPITSPGETPVVYTSPSETPHPVLNPVQRPTLPPPNDPWGPVTSPGRPVPVDILAQQREEAERWRILKERERIGDTSSGGWDMRPPGNVVQRPNGLPVPQAPVPQPPKDYSGQAIPAPGSSFPQAPVVIDGGWGQTRPPSQPMVGTGPVTAPGRPQAPVSAVPEQRTTMAPTVSQASAPSPIKGDRSMGASYGVQAPAPQQPAQDAGRMGGGWRDRMSNVRAPGYAIGTDTAAQYANSGMGGSHIPTSSNPGVGADAPNTLKKLAELGIPIPPAVAAAMQGQQAAGLNFGRAWNDRGMGTMSSMQGINAMDGMEREAYEGMVEGPGGLPFQSLMDFLGKSTSHLGRAQRSKMAA